jgi:hypothetical protein
MLKRYRLTREQLTYASWSFPYGLTCPECQKLLRPGDLIVYESVRNEDGKKKRIIHHSECYGKIEAEKQTIPLTEQQ